MKKLYLTVNPFGGHKKGPRILKEVLPLFEKNNFDLTIIETEYAGHNKQLAMDVDMTDYDGFCCIGGDGTLSEVINGVMKREDSLKFPIGLITGGTGHLGKKLVDNFIKKDFQVILTSTSKTKISKIYQTNPTITTNLAGGGPPPQTPPPRRREKTERRSARPTLVRRPSDGRESTPDL